MPQVAAYPAELKEIPWPWATIAYSEEAAVRTSPAFSWRNGFLDREQQAYFDQATGNERWSAVVASLLGEDPAGLPLAKDTGWRPFSFDASGHLLLLVQAANPPAVVVSQGKALGDLLQIPLEARGEPKATAAEKRAIRGYVAKYGLLMQSNVAAGAYFFDRCKQFVALCQRLVQALRKGGQVYDDAGPLLWRLTPDGQADPLALSSWQFWLLEHEAIVPAVEAVPPRKHLRRFRQHPLLSAAMIATALLGINCGLYQQGVRGNGLRWEHALNITFCSSCDCIIPLGRRSAERRAYCTACRPEARKARQQARRAADPEYAERVRRQAAARQRAWRARQKAASNPE